LLIVQFVEHSVSSVVQFVERIQQAAAELRELGTLTDATALGLIAAT
jgi:hypothetical protein